MLLGDINPFKSTFTFEKSVSRDDVEKALTSIVIKDSDGDGLRDWEEALWKTDPKNKDSDGDGTTDGEEVRDGRDPTVPGPQDRIKTDTNNGSTNESKPETITDIVIEKALATFLLEQQNGAIDETTREKLAATLMQETSGINILTYTPTYKLENLNIVGNSIEEFNIYKDNFIQVLNKHLREYPENELDIVTKALRNEDGGELKKLDGEITGYKIAVKELLSIKTPSELAKKHLEIINAHIQIADSLENMKYSITDPMVGLIGILQFTEYFESGSNNVIEILSLINDKQKKDNSEI